MILFYPHSDVIVQVVDARNPLLFRCYSAVMILFYPHSDVIVQVVDARNPLLFRCNDSV